MLLHSAAAAPQWLDRVKPERQKLARLAERKGAEGSPRRRQSGFTCSAVAWLDAIHLEQDRVRLTNRIVVDAAAVVPKQRSAVRRDIRLELSDQLGSVTDFDAK